MQAFNIWIHIVQALNWTATQFKFQIDKNKVETILSVLDVLDAKEIVRILAKTS